jgi:hypothetical protein
MTLRHAHRAEERAALRSAHHARTMQRRARLPRLFSAMGAALLALVAHHPTARAAADDASNWVVIPWVASDVAITTRVTISNPMPGWIAVPDISFVAADLGTGSPPGLVRCATQAVNPMTDMSFDVATVCNLSAAPSEGAMHIRTRYVPGHVERISATASIEYRNASNPSTVEQRVAVDGIPMGALPGNLQDQVVDGLGDDGSGNLRTDCYVLTGLDGSRAGGLLAAIRLRDEQNAQVGSDVLITAHPLAVRKIEDVFRHAGLSGAKLTGVRAQFAFAGGDDHALAYCSTQRIRTPGQAPAVSYHVALPLDPTGPTRSRSVTANSDLANPTFTVTGTESAAHAIYVRHPDRLRCNVVSTDPAFSTMLLKIALRDADKNWLVDNGTPSTDIVEIPAKSTVTAGTSNIWMLHVEQVSPDANASIPYAVRCESGNGTSAPDYRFVFTVRPN